MLYEVITDGQAIWSRLVNGVVTKTMDSQWQQFDERLELSFPANVALQSGLASVAPLGLNPADSGGPGGPGNGRITSYNVCYTKLLRDL